MSISNSDITAKNLKKFYEAIYPYLNSEPGAIGSIICILDEDVPEHYIECNGQIVNISEYPKLAQYFENKFGESNYFGGDGISTFGIPEIKFTEGSWRNIGSVSPDSMLTYCIATENLHINYLNSSGGGQGGLLPRLMISAMHGSTIYCGKGSESIQANEISDGLFECNLTDYGDWTLTASYDNKSYSSTIKIDTCKIYNINTNDDIQKWLLLGGVTTPFSSLSEILEDSYALSQLMSSEPAVDFLVTCTGWIGDICNSESAMYYIGINEYCALKLLGDEYWRPNICTSIYFENVLNKKVPLLTNRNQGEIASNAFSNTYYAYKVFDGSSSSDDGWISGNGTMAGAWIGYTFDVPTRIYKIFLQNINASRNAVKDFKLQGSNDKATWHDLDAFINPSSDAVYHDDYYPSETGEYIHYRIYIESIYKINSANTVSVGNLQFYGRPVSSI